MSGPYSRIYWSVMDDTKFDDIRADMRHFGTWSLMLVVADMAYPAPAYIPPTAPKRSVQALVDAGLVDLLPGFRFRVHGLDAERGRRSQRARESVSHRYDTPTTVEIETYDRSTTDLLAETEPRQSKAEAVVARETDPADAYWSLAGRYPTGKVIVWIDDLSGKYGQEATTRAIVKAHVEDGSISTLLGRAANILAAEARSLDRKERADEQQRLREKRAVPKPMTGPDAEFRAMLEARYARPPESAA